MKLDKEASKKFGINVMRKKEDKKASEIRSGSEQKKKKSFVKSENENEGLETKFTREE